MAHGAWRTPRHLRQNQPPRHAGFTASEKNVDVARRLATFRRLLSPTSDLSYLFWAEYFWNAHSARLPRLVKVDHCCVDSAYNCNDSCYDLPPVSFYGFAVCLRRVESPAYFLNPFLRFGGKRTATTKLRVRPWPSRVSQRSRVLPGEHALGSTGHRRCPSQHRERNGYPDVQTRRKPREEAKRHVAVDAVARTKCSANCIRLLRKFA